MKDFSKLSLKEKAAILKMRAGDLCSMLTGWDPGQEKSTERVLDKVESMFNEIKDELNEKIKRYKETRKET